MKKILQKVFVSLILLLGLTGCGEQATLLEEQYKENYVQDMEQVIDTKEIAEDVVYTGMVAGTEEMFYLFREFSEGKYVWKLKISDLENDSFSTVRLLKNALFEDNQIPDRMMVDEAGNIYMRFSEEGNYVWKILSAEDVVTRKLSTVVDSNVALTALPDGQVGLLHFYWQSGATLESANIADLYSLDKQGEENLLVTAEPGAIFMTMQDNEWLVYATGEGVYRRTVEGGEKELLYLWNLHGISFPEIKGMQVDEQGRVCILLDKEGELTYIRLSPPEIAGEPVPTPELDTEPVQITFLGNPWSDYRDLIVEFQKLYPQYTVMKVSYPDEERLLTELMAGKGPVLIDTNNVSFKENVEYWECLDEELETSELNGAILDKLLVCGQIDGKQYGLPCDWSIFTYGTMHEGVEDWNQEEFLEYLKNHPEIESIFAEQNPFFFIHRFFCFSLEDCMFIDMETKTAKFDTEEFKQVVELATRLGQKHEVANHLMDRLEEVKDKTCLGIDLYPSDPEGIGFYMTIFEKKLNIIGFPGKDGSNHYINAAYPLVIRETATAAEKKAAFTFLEFLLSYEGQVKYVLGESQSSVREDVFEEQLQDLLPDNTWYSYNDEVVEITVTPEEWTAEFEKIYEKLVPLPDFPADLEQIMREELEPYFDGEKELEETIEILQNRVQLWLDENL